MDTPTARYAGRWFANMLGGRGEGPAYVPGLYLLGTRETRLNDIKVTRHKRCSGFVMRCRGDPTAQTVFLYKLYLLASVEVAQPHSGPLGTSNCIAKLRF
jgi:hypothetical protein